MSEKTDIHSSSEEAILIADSSVGDASVSKENAFDSGLLRSPEFLNRLRKLPENCRQEVIGLVLDYSVLHPDGFMLNEAVDRIMDVSFGASMGKPDSGEVNALFTESILKKLGLEKANDQEKRNAVVDYCYEYLYERGKYYQGFNGAFEEDIRENGITTGRRKWDWDELKRIDAICKRCGCEMVLGWAQLGCENTSYVSETAQFTYRYANASPEWFAQFTSEGYHIKGGQHEKTAYLRRDYETAKANVLEFCDRLMSRSQEDIQAGKAYPNMTIEEKVHILSFFEKYWNEFAGPNSGPKVALIARTEIDTEGDIVDKELIKSLKNPAFYSKDTNQIVGFFRSGFNDNKPITHNIPPEKITIVDLPAYAEVYGDR